MPLIAQSKSPPFTPHHLSTVFFVDSFFFLLTCPYQLRSSAKDIIFLRAAMDGSASPV